MKRMITRATALAAAWIVALIPLSAQASNFYIIPDSDKRTLTYDELWTWQYDALGYIFNEIFARHGYHFEPGGKYDNYFRAQRWYRPNERYGTNQEIYDRLMTDVDWRNESLIKDVRAEMRALNTTNPAGKPLPKVAYEPPIGGAFSSFEEIALSAGQKLPVYSGPGDWYYRAALGKAVVSTNGYVYAGGVEDGWMMVMYWTNNGHVRVGYANIGGIKDKVFLQELSFTYLSATVTVRCGLTDDPVASYQKLTTLSEGQTVTYLSEYVNEQRWAYVECDLGGQPARGFVPAEYIVIDGFEKD